LIIWKLTEQHADYVMRVLQARPYQEVAQLINELVAQANQGTPVEMPKPAAESVTQ
jgi:hypothetical protein